MFKVSHPFLGKNGRILDNTEILGRYFTQTVVFRIGVKKAV